MKEGPDIKEFLDSSQSNCWLRENDMYAYVRKGFHLGLDGQIAKWFDIANVEVKVKKDRGQFTRWLKTVESEISKTSLYGIFGEAIQNDRLLAFLLKNGYKHYPFDLGTPCVYKLIKDLK